MKEKKKLFPFRLTEKMIEDITKASAKENRSMNNWAELKFAKILNELDSPENVALKKEMISEAIDTGSVVLKTSKIKNKIQQEVVRGEEKAKVIAQSKSVKKPNPFEGWDEIKNTDDEIKNLNLKTKK